MVRKARFTLKVPLTPCACGPVRHVARRLERVDRCLPGWLLEGGAFTPHPRESLSRRR